MWNGVIEWRSSRVDEWERECRLTEATWKESTGDAADRPARRRERHFTGPSRCRAVAVLSNCDQQSGIELMPSVDASSSTHVNNNTNNSMLEYVCTEVYALEWYWWHSVLVNSDLWMESILSNGCSGWSPFTNSLDIKWKLLIHM